MTLLGISAGALGACGGDDGLDRAKAPGCYDRPSLEADVTAVEPSEDPAAACAAAWRRGDVERGTRRAPRLAVCVGDEGTPLVFPAEGGDLCGSLGLDES